jgi:hypothetical protein
MKRVNLEALLAATVPFTFVMLMVGCATNGTLSKELDAKLSEQKAPTGIEQIGKEARSGIRNSKGLTAQQKEKLLALQRHSETKAKELRETSLKLREILIRDLTSSNYSDQEVALIKDRLKGVEDQRLSNIFDTVDQVNSIVGRESADRESVLRSFDFDDSHVRF